MDKQETAERIVQKLVENGSFSRWLGIRVKEVQPGSVTLEMTVRPEMLNGLSVAHGGIAFSLADSALGLSSNSRGRKCLALETNISYIQKVEAGDVLTAHTEELSLGKKVGVYRIIITRKDDKTVAIFRGTVYRTKDRHSPDGESSQPQL